MSKSKSNRSPGQSIDEILGSLKTTPDSYSEDDFEELQPEDEDVYDELNENDEDY